MDFVTGYEADVGGLESERGVPPREFAGRTLAIATMHGKEAVIAPVLERRLGVRCVVPAGFDTDRFGTFSGEVARDGTPREVARRKARAAMRSTGTRLAVASEGSFGPDPRAPIVTLAHELVLLVDDEHGLEIAGEDVGHDTNHGERHCADLAAVEAFVDRLGFPSHGVILASPDVPREFAKGIGDLVELRSKATLWLERHGGVVVSSDLRACHNPTRMAAIGRAAAALAARCVSRCPRCERPGFGRVDVVDGLPCADCDAPTGLVRTVVDGCAACDHRAEGPRPDGRTVADPANCPRCNP